MDPTYDKEAINAKPEWKLAHILSEIMNDGAPIGWGKYIGPARCLLANLDVAEKGEIARLRAERDEAVRLLEPFAKAADIIEEGDYHWADNQHITKGITMGSLRKARAAIGKDE